MASCGTSEAFFQINQKKLKYLLTTTAPCAIISLVESRDSQMRVCWNRQTGTFEGRVSLTYGFKSRHSHQPFDLENGLDKPFLRSFLFLSLGLILGAYLAFIIRIAVYFGDVSLCHFPNAEKLYYVHNNGWAFFACFTALSLFPIANGFIS